MARFGSRRVSSLLIFFLPSTLGANASFDALTYVDPLIGSVNGGNVFVGATWPYGMAKAVADVDGQNTAGFSPDGSNVTGFSTAHDSGTGGFPSLGNFPLFPQMCSAGDDLDGCQFRLGDRKVGYQPDSVVARPGYFSLKLNSSISAEAAVAQKTTVWRFKFPPARAGTAAMLLLDLTDLNQSRQKAYVHVDAATGRMTGNGTFLPSFGAGSFDMYFCVDFFGARQKDNGVWANHRGGLGTQELSVYRGFNSFLAEAGGFVRFANLTADDAVTARVALSYKSVEQACATAEREVPDPVGQFASLRQAAERAWREKLSPVSVDAARVGEDLQKTFWSAMYRAMVSPQNYTGENPHWDSGIPYFDSFYCLWDAFRTTQPFLSVIDPSAQTQMLATLLDIYKHEGWLPDCHMSMCKGWTQGGSNADVVLVDAYVKNVTTDLDWNLALEAIVNDAENEPAVWANHGRGGLTSWKRLGYIPFRDFDPVGFGTDSRSISRTVEYSYNDHCLATLAQGLGHANLYTKYLARGANWQKLWRADQRSVVKGTDTGFSGFLQPRNLNGTWAFQDPIACSPLTGFCSLTGNPSETFEASVWIYSFLVPQSQSTLIGLMGGDANFVKRLDFLHTSGLAEISNEPTFATVFLYHYAGRPALSAARLHSYFPASFGATPDGLPGNDDGGAMAAFIWFSMIGLYPVAGQDVYLLLPPFFAEVNVTNPTTGKTATVRAVNFDPSYKAICIQSVTVNGKPWTKSWIGHEFFREGWTLEMTLGATESDWGTKPEHRPPSYVAGSLSKRFDVEL